MENVAVKRSFSALSLSPRPLGASKAKGDQLPTPVQEEVIPKALAGKDQHDRAKK